MSQFKHIDISKYKPVHKDFLCPWGSKHDIYEIPLSELHLNKDNGRIASWVSGYENDNNSKSFDEMTREEWNATLIDFIKQSSSADENARTKKSITQFGQIKVGAILTDGTVVAGNRRCSILMALLNDTGEYDRYGKFLCAIFDVPDNEEGRKELKRLETKTQYGEDAPVAYGPIERLVDIYRNVIAPDHAYSDSEYRNFLGMTKSDFKDLCARAEILVDYLSYIGHPFNYEIARVEKLDGLINELARVYKKVDKSEWNRIKGSFFKTVKEATKDRTRVVRAQVKTYFEKPEKFEEDLSAQDDALFEADAVGFDKKADKNAIAESTRSRQDFFLEQSLKISKEKARSKPLSYLDSAIDSIGKIDKIAIDIMDGSEQIEFYKKVKNLIGQLQKLSKDK